MLSYYVILFYIISYHIISYRIIPCHTVCYANMYLCIYICVYVLYITLHYIILFWFGGISGEICQKAWSRFLWHLSTKGNGLTPIAHDLRWESSRACRPQQPFQWCQRVLFQILNHQRHGRKICEVVQNQ